MADYTDIANFIREEIPDCEFVGLVKGEKEVLIAFNTSYYDPQQRKEAKRRLMAEFPGKIRRVIEVAKPSLRQLQRDLKTVEGLNETGAKR